MGEKTSESAESGETDQENVESLETPGGSTEDQPGPKEGAKLPPPEDGHHDQLATTLDHLRSLAADAGPKVRAAVRAVGGPQSLGVWTVAFLLLLHLFATIGTNSRLTSVEAELDSIGYSVGSLDRRVGNAAVLQLDSIKMQGSNTWTLPVSSIPWSGR